MKDLIVDKKYFITRESTQARKFTPKVVERMVRLIQLGKAVRSEIESYENISK